MLEHKNINKILYLRTLFALNLKAGGSVGHTAGVINSLSRKVNLVVYSNDKLPGVSHPINIIKPWISRIFPGLILELLCNLQFFLKVDVHSINPDAIYQRHSFGSFIGAYFAKKHNIPFVLEFNSSEYWKLHNWIIKSTGIKSNLIRVYNSIFQLKIVKLIEDYNLATASEIVVVSNVLKDDLIRRGILPEKIIVNPNGIDLEKFHPGVASDEFKSSLNLNGKKIIGFIGTFGQWHGVEELAHAIVSFYAQNKSYKESVRFLLVGNGLLFPNVKEILVKGGCSDYVIMPGIIPQEDAPKYLDICDIFVSPHIPNPDGSRFFGSPTKLFEYMAMEKGIIASRLEQIAEILEDGSTAKLVEPGNIDELVDSFNYLLQNHDLAAQMGKKARCVVASHHTWDIHVEKILRNLEVYYEN